MYLRRPAYPTIPDISDVRRPAARSTVSKYNPYRIGTRTLELADSDVPIIDR